MGQKSVFAMHYATHLETTALTEWPLLGRQFPLSSKGLERQKLREPCH
jgi:hypothetical protein